MMYQSRDVVMKIFTLGYQGINIQEYITTLLTNDVAVVLDVRETPWSYKRDFSRSNFSQQLEDFGIQYVHVKSAGNPSKNRKTASSVRECLDRYKDLLEADDGCVHELIDLIRTFEQQGKKVCLTCFEKHHQECHRSVLTDFIEEHVSNVQIAHLQAEQDQMAFQSI